MIYTDWNTIGIFDCDSCGKGKITMRERTIYSKSDEKVITDRAGRCNKCGVLETIGFDPNVLKDRMVAYSVSHYMASSNKEKILLILHLQLLKKRYELISGDRLFNFIVTMHDFGSGSSKEFFIPADNVIEAYQIAEQSGIAARPLSVHPYL